MVVPASTTVSSSRVLGPITQFSAITVLPRRMHPGRMTVPGGDDDLRLDIDVIADEFHAVIQVALKGGGIALPGQLKFLFGSRHREICPPYYTLIKYAARNWGRG